MPRRPLSNCESGPDRTPEETLELWMKHHSPFLLRRARYYGRTADEAEDDVQDTFVAAYGALYANEKAAELSRQEVGSPGVLRWLTTVLGNIILGKLRIKKTRLFNSRGVDFTQQTDMRQSAVDEALASAEESVLLDELIAGLDELQETIVKLRLGGDLTFAEIDEWLEIGHGKAHREYHKAVEAMKLAWRQRGR